MVFGLLNNCLMARGFNFRTFFWWAVFVLVWRIVPVTRAPAGGRGLLQMAVHLKKEAGEHHCECPPAEALGFMNGIYKRSIITLLIVKLIVKPEFHRTCSKKSCFFLVNFVFYAC